MMYRRSSLWRMAIAAFALALCGACAARTPRVERAPVNLLAVLPIEAAQAEPDPTARQRAAPPAPLPPDAGAAITGQIYRVLAHRSEFRFVPDVAVADALRREAVRQVPDRVARAVALGKAVGAEGVIFGRVSRFRERVGTEFGATQPAAVSFDLGLVVVSTGDVIWEGRFDQTQEPLSANLLNWWMFWRGGPRWFTARELAGLGVERLFEEMKSKVLR